MSVRGNLCYLIYRNYLLYVLRYFFHVSNKYFKWSWSCALPYAVRYIFDISWILNRKKKLDNLLKKSRVIFLKVYIETLAEWVLITSSIWNLTKPNLWRSAHLKDCGHYFSSMCTSQNHLNQRILGFLN